jgi:hypothetical protein
MERIEKDATPAEEWEQSLNATCNRLSNQYLNLLKAAAAAPSTQQHDPRAGGGHMASLQDPPPPPLAANIAQSQVQCRAATENICVAASHLLGLIRTLRLSLLLMDQETIEAEEELQVIQAQELMKKARLEAAEIEKDWLELRHNYFHQIE